MAKVVYKDSMEKHDNLTLVFNSSPIGMIILNDDVTISEINNAALNFIEKTYDEVIGMPFGDAFDCIGSFDDVKGCGFGKNCNACIFRKAVISAFEDGTTSQSLEFNKIIMKSDKPVEIWFRSSITPVNIEEKRKIFVSLADITDSKQKELSAIKAKQAAEAATRVKSEFLANMSHEIRTPLNGVIGMIDLTLMTELNTEQRENLETAKSCANSLLHVINDILDFSKLEANKLVIETVEFDINNLIEETIKAHSSMAHNKGLELSYSFSSNIPQFLIGDPNRLKQVLDNVIGNAIKFTEKGRVTIIVKNRNRTNESAELQFIVSDTGIGISKEDIGKLFQSFSQVDGSITRKFGGTGLGLSISNQLVKLMGGSIWVESEKGKGSNFFFNLGFKIAGQRNKEDTQTLAFRRADHPMTILLVEDNIISQRVISRMLKEKGHSVDIASNGFEALKLHDSKKYDIILMDVYMPEMDGIEATKRIREKEELGRRTPIIAVTAEALHRAREHFLALGMDEYLAKPIKMEELFEMLEQVYEEKIQSQAVSHKGKLTGKQEETVLINKKFKEQDLQWAEHIANHISALEDSILNNDFKGIEESAHKIKEFAIQMDVEEIKDTAFKIELSARRENLLEAAEYAKQIQFEFETFKKSLKY